MPSTNAVRFEFAVYVEPEHVERFKELIHASDDRLAIQLAFEKEVGRYLEASAHDILPSSLGAGSDYDYGVGVAEVYVEYEGSLERDTLGVKPPRV